MTTFHQFEPLSQNSVRNIIAASPSSTSRLDPIPTWILKMCLDELVPIITNIVNHSLLHGHFPEAMKHAHITPLLKKPNLDTEQLKNYRPIANLSFLSKTIERAAAAQLQNYLTDNNLHGHFQSAYRKTS